jgi:hypothetical protein
MTYKDQRITTHPQRKREVVSETSTPGATVQRRRLSGDMLGVMWWGSSNATIFTSHLASSFSLLIESLSLFILGQYGTH